MWNLTAQSHVLVLTGAGISAESGVPTFRDAGVLWDGHDVTDVASPEGFAADPLLVWAFYSERRAALAGIAPNAGHFALVGLEKQLGDRFLLATQAIDGLHVAAGGQSGGRAREPGATENSATLPKSAVTQTKRPAGSIASE